MGMTRLEQDLRILEKKNPPVRIFKKMPGKKSAHALTIAAAAFVYTFRKLSRVDRARRAREAPAPQGVGAGGEDGRLRGGGAVMKDFSGGRRQEGGGQEEKGEGGGGHPRGGGRRRRQPQVGVERNSGQELKLRTFIVLSITSARSEHLRFFK